MLELSGRVIGKLRDMADEEFEQLELTEEQAFLTRFPYGQGKPVFYSWQ